MHANFVVTEEKSNEKTCEFIKTFSNPKCYFENSMLLEEKIGVHFVKGLDITANNKSHNLICLNTSRNNDILTEFRLLKDGEMYLSEDTDRLEYLDIITNRSEVDLIFEIGINKYDRTDIMFLTLTTKRITLLKKMMLLKE